MPSESCRFVFASVHTSRRFTIFGESSCAPDSRAPIDDRYGHRAPTGRAGGGRELASRSSGHMFWPVMFFGC